MNRIPSEIGVAYPVYPASVWREVTRDAYVALRVIHPSGAEQLLEVMPLSAMFDFQLHKLSLRKLEVREEGMHTLALISDGVEYGRTMLNIAQARPQSYLA